VKPQDPTTNGDAVGYLREQASFAEQNCREDALSDKCAEYLRAVIAENKRLHAALDAISNNGGLL
jgi:hypothetical protein